MIEEARAGIPDHEIKYEDKLSPAWKGTWDMARQLYRERKYREALVQYEILLAQKENVAEARWEYVTILLGMERWQHAGQQLESLLAFDPENLQYRMAAARVCLEAGNVDKAADLYRRLYDSDREGPESMEALAGLVRALQGAGAVGELVPLMKELVARKPADMELQRELVGLLLEVGRFAEARAILNRLEQEASTDAAVDDLQARVHARAGDQEGAAGYWRRLVEHDRDNLEANRWLQAYYARKNDWPKSLKHLEAVMRSTPSDPVLLEQAASLNMKLGRVDTALHYYEYCLALKPGDPNLQNNKRDAQRVMARNLMPLVENGAGHRLWQDLAQVTRDRAGVFREMATLLREKGQIAELVDVLALLYRENPQDLPAYRELVSLLADGGRGDELKALQRQGTME
jgi:tetratricopeptide (TPR) repeat protein